MKIAWMHSHFNNWMGGTRFVLEVVKRLQKKNTVVIFIQNGNPDVIRKFTEAGILVSELKTPSTNSPLFWLGFPYFCRQNARDLQAIFDTEGFDIVISSMFPMNHIASLLKDKAHYQYCYEPFAFFWDMHLRRTLPLKERLITGALAFLYSSTDRRATRQAKKIFTLSGVTQRQIRETYDRDSIITYEGVDLDFFKPQHNEELALKYADRSIILHCTDFTPIKRTDLAIKIFAALKIKIPAAKLLVTHTCENFAAQKKLESLAAREGLRKDDYEFLGFVPHNLLPAYYSLAKILLQPTINQPQSLPVKEALACETPVARGFAEEVEFSEKDRLGVIIDPLQVTDAASKIFTFLNGNLFLKERSRRYVEEKFNWDKITDIIYSAVERDAA